MDIPLGLSSNDLEEIRFFEGSLRIRKGLLKLARILSLDVRFILADYDFVQDKSDIISYPVDDEEQIFSIFQNAINKTPYLWDKVIDISKFYKPDSNLYAHLPFAIEDGNYYIYCLNNDKIVRVSESLYKTSMKLKNREEMDIDSISEDIFAKSGLRLNYVI